MDNFTTGLIRAVVVQSERIEAGKETRGMAFQGFFDDFVLTLASIRPRAASLFTKTFSGWSLRSARMNQAANGMHPFDGLVLENFLLIFNHLKILNYTGPLAVGTDETKCVESLQIHNTHLVGAQGGDHTFGSAEELAGMSKEIVANKQLCSKVCLFHSNDSLISSGATYSLTPLRRSRFVHKPSRFHYLVFLHM